MPEPTDIVITGMGMRCGVGHHALQSCASVRAGISRVAGWKHFGGGDASPPLAVSAVEPDLGDGSWTDKAGALLDDPLTELLWNTELVEPKGRIRMGAFVAAPPGKRPGTPEPAAAYFASQVRQQIRLPATLASAVVVGGEHAAGATALQQALEALQQGRLDVCILAGVDSLLHGPYLAWLNDQGRLKFADVSSGITPGEAGACVTLETRAHADQRGVPALCKIASLGLDAEPAPLDLFKPAKGLALARAIQQIMPVAQNDSAIQQVYSDLNGERWRFQEWAMTNVRLSVRFARGWKMNHPAEFLGDIGAAWVPSALCMAAHAFQRRCAGLGGGGSILVNATSESGPRAAILVAAA